MNLNDTGDEFFILKEHNSLWSEGQRKISLVR